MVMLGFALLAAVKPAYDDWLNERSSTPPVSSTMQALNVLPAAVVAAVLEPVAAGAVVVGLALQAARAMAATETTAAIFIDERKALSISLLHKGTAKRRRTAQTLAPACPRSGPLDGFSGQPVTHRRPVSTPHRAPSQPGA